MAIDVRWVGSLACPEWATVVHPMFRPAVGADTTFIAGAGTNAAPNHPYGGNRRYVKHDMNKASPAATLRVGMSPSITNFGAIYNGPDATKRWGLHFQALDRFTTAAPASQVHIWRISTSDEFIHVYRNADLTYTLTVDAGANPGYGCTATSTITHAQDTDGKLELLIIYRYSSGVLLPRIQYALRLIENLSGTPTVQTLVNVNDNGRSPGAGSAFSAFTDWRIGDSGTNWGHTAFSGDFVCAGLDCDNVGTYTLTRAVPNATGSAEDAWTLGAGASKTVAVSDDPGETETTDYITAALTTTAQTMALPDSLVGASDTIMFLGGFLRWRNTNAPKSNNAMAMYIDDGTTEQSVTISNSVDSLWHDQGADLGYMVQFLKAPDASAWSPTDLDNTMLGVRLVGTQTVGNSHEVTMMFGEVCSIVSGDEAAAPPPSPVMGRVFGARQAINRASTY